jgi:hypothetical protein
VAQQIIGTDPDLEQHQRLGKLLADQRQRLSQGANLN